MAREGVYRLPIASFNARLRLLGFTARVVCVNSRQFAEPLTLSADGANSTDVERGFRLLAQDLRCTQADVSVATLKQVYNNAGQTQLSTTAAFEERASLIGEQPRESIRPTALAMPFNGTPAVYLVFADMPGNKAYNAVVIPAMVSCSPTALANKAIHQVFAHFRTELVRQFPRRTFRPHNVWAFVSPGESTVVSAGMLGRLPRVKKMSHFVHPVEGDAFFSLATVKYVQQLLRELQVTDQRIVMLSHAQMRPQYSTNAVWHHDGSDHLMAGIVCRQ